MVGEGYAKAIQARRQRSAGPTLYLIALKVVWHRRVGGVIRLLDGVGLRVRLAPPPHPGPLPRGARGRVWRDDGWEACCCGSAKVTQRQSGRAGNDPHGQLPLPEGAGPEGSRMAWRREGHPGHAGKDSHGQLPLPACGERAGVRGRARVRHRRIGWKRSAGPPRQKIFKVSA